jgi:hypothetical protein
MKRITLLPLLALFLSAGAVQSQAPLSTSPAAALQDMVTANKALIEKQQKTLDLLDKLDEDAQQLKIFGKRS